MPFLVDGDNLLGTWPGRRRSDAERRRLAMRLGRLAARERRRVVTVFDGTAPPGVAFGADVLFAGPDRSADEVILARLRAEARPGEWVVVTSDRSLADQCRWVGARVERSDRFRGRLSEGGAGEKPERVDDLDYWLEQFGDEEE